MQEDGRAPREQVSSLTPPPGGLRGSPGPIQGRCERDPLLLIEQGHHLVMEVAPEADLVAVEVDGHGDAVVPGLEKLVDLRGWNTWMSITPGLPVQSSPSSLTSTTGPSAVRPAAAAGILPPLARNPEP